jgi:hypothetical protein
MQFVANRFLKTTPEERKLLKEDKIAYQVFIEEEKKKVGESFVYFLENYGSHQPADGGAPEPLIMWNYQPKIAKVLEKGQDTICLKSRRIGFTLIVCHYLVWTAGLSAKTPGARCIAISKNQRDADELLATCRTIVNCLPDYLRPAIGSEAKDDTGQVGKESTKHFSFPLRAGASIRSLPSSSSAARSYTATLLFLDELAFHNNSDEVWVSSKPTTEGGGQVITGSTGNGRSGDGGHFYYLWEQARKEEIMEPIFIPWYDREDRTQKWYDDTMKTMPTEDKMRQEYPATAEEAFAGQAENLAFSASAISAAEKLGAQYDEMFSQGALPPPDGNIFVGIDWGLNSAGIVVYPLAGFGFYLAAELVTNTDDAETFSKKIIDLGGKVAKRNGSELERAYYDAAGAQQMKSFQRIAPPEIRVTGIPFNKYKMRSLEFTRMLLKRTQQGEEIGFIAISKRCKETLTQMKDIKQKDDGRLEKGNDHSVDAVLAAMAQQSVIWDREVHNR